MQELFYTSPNGVKLRYAWARTRETSVRGTVLCLHGRMECLEVYEEQTADWNRRGFDVVMFDWRGQGGSERPIKHDPHRHHIASFHEYRSDLRHFHADVAAKMARGKMLLFAHSMGGCVALDWLTKENSPDIKAAILTAPMLAIPVPSAIYGPVLLACHAAIKLGFEESYIPGESRFEVASWTFENNVLTSDPRRFRVIPDCFAARPDLSVGGVTWGWLRAALKAVERVRETLPSLRVNALVFSSGEDKVVPYSELGKWIRRIPNVSEKFYPEAKHTIMLETDSIRDRVWRDIDGFLKDISV